MLDEEVITAGDLYATRGGPSTCALRETCGMGDWMQQSEPRPPRRDECLFPLPPPRLGDKWGKSAAVPVAAGAGRPPFPLRTSDHC